MATAGEVAKQFNDRLAGIQDWVTGQIETRTKAVKADVLKESQQKEEIKIAEFAKTHPELKPNSEVAAIMEQLYATNTDLEDIYKKACSAVGAKAVAIVEGKDVNLLTGNPIGKDGKEVEAKEKTKEKVKPVSSLRSDILGTDTEDVEDGDIVEEKDITDMSIREVAESNWNKALADAGEVDVPE